LKYLGIVTRQMRFIADMTDDRWFNREANLAVTTSAILVSCM
jgi:hypothetical protein